MCMCVLVSLWLPEIHNACVCVGVFVVLVSMQLPEVHDACVCVLVSVRYRYLKFTMHVCVGVCAVT